MPAASIRSLVNGISPIVGASRDDLRPGDVVTLQSVNVHTTYAWTMADKPDGSAAVFSGSALNASPGTFTVDLEGPYLIRLTADLGLPTETTQFVRLRLLTLFGDLKLIAAGEQLNSSIPVPVDQTPTGWAHTLNTDIQTLLDFIATVSTSGRVYYVDANSGTEGYADYSVIQDAIDAAAGSATATTPWVVLVRPGLYTENLTFQPHVHVVGWPGSAPGSSTAGGDARVCVVRGTHVVSTSASTDVVLLSSLLLETVSGGTAATLRKDGAGSLLLYRCAVEQNGISLTQGPAVQVRQGIAVIDNCKILASASLADDRVALTQTGFASSTLSVRASDIQGPTGVVLNELGGSGVLAEFKHTRISTTGGASSRGLISDAAALLLEYCRVAVDGTGAPLAFHPGAGVLATAVIGIIRWSYIAGTISFDTTGVGGATALTVGSSEYTGFSFPGGTPGTLTATTNSTSLFYDNTTSGITAENVQDAIDEVYAYASLVRTLDDAYDGGGVPGSGRTIIADTGAVQIVDAPVPSEPVPPDNTDGRLQVVGNVEVGSIGKPEIDLDPNPFGNGPMLSMGRLIQANNAPFGSTAFVLAQSTGTPDFNNYNLRLQSESSDGGSLIGKVILRGGDGLANGAGTPLGGSVYIQAGWTLAGPLDAGDVFLVPGDAPGVGAAGSTVFVRPQDATQATLTAAGVFVGGVTGTIRFATDMGAIEVDILAGDNLATVLGKFDATKQVTATQTLGVITLTTVSRGPVAEIHYLNDTVGNTLDTALGGFNGQSQVDGTWPSSITFRVSADHEISIGLEGTTGALIYNADTGKLTVPGVIDPTAIVFELSSAPTTTATEGAFFFSDGTGGLTLGAPYFRGPSDAVPVALSGGGGGGVSGPGSSTDNALVRWDGAGGATIQNSTGWTLSDAGLLSGSSGSLTLPQAAAPTPTAEGAISWDTNDDVLRVGNGSSTLTIPTTSTTLSGGDLGGSLAIPTVTDLTITGEVQGSVLYFNGSNWVQLAPGTSGQFLQTNGAGANPAWAAGGGGGVSGPGSSTDNALVRWDGVGGASIQNSTGWTLSDAGLLSGSSGSLTLPQAAAPTPTAEGAVAWDTNDDVLRVGDGSSTLTIPTTSTTLSGGDLGGTLAIPTVTDFTITGEVQGSVLYFNGSNWVQLAPGTSGQFLQTNGAGANPAWAAGGGGGNVTDVTFDVAASPGTGATEGALFVSDGTSGLTTGQLYFQGPSNATAVRAVKLLPFCRLMTGTNVASLAGGAPNPVDSVTPAVGDRILVSAQTTGSEGGVYVVTTVGTGSDGTWVRSTDVPSGSSDSLYTGTTFFIAEGTVNGGTRVMVTNTGTITVGTTALTFFQEAPLASVANTVRFTEHFLAPPFVSVTTSVVGTMLVSVSGSAAAPSGQATTLAARPGVVRLGTGTTATGRCAIHTTQNGIRLGGGEWRVGSGVLPAALSTGTERYQFIVGLVDNPASLPQADGCYFLYDEGGVHTGSAASANWQCVTTASSTRTFTTTTVAVSASVWADLEIRVNDAGTSVAFFIDGVLVATHTTNIPTGVGALVCVGSFLFKSIGTTAASVDLDYITATANLT